MSTMDATATRRDAGNWGLVLVQGIAALIIGLLLVSAPEATLTFMVLILGAYWLVSGILAIVRIFTGSSELNWFWSLAVGVLGIVAGLIVLRHPLWSSILVPTIIVLFLGINALIMGVLNLVRGFGGDGAGYVAIAILDFIFGFILLGSPFVAAAILPVVLGIFALIGGIAMIITSFSMRGSSTGVIEQESRKAA